MDRKIELVQISGAGAGRRCAVPGSGLRIGRASSNDLCIPDEELSRNHCLIEFAAEEPRIVDLASANGTYVNGVAVKSEPCALHAGDVIEIGETRLRVVDAGAEAQSATVDLGLEPQAAGGNAPETAPSKPSGGRRAPWMQAILWVLGLLALAGAGWFFLFPPERETESPGEHARQLPLAGVQNGFFALYYENVEADGSHIFRYQMTIGPDAVLRVVSDDVPGENRHVDKSAKLSPESLAHVDAIFKTAGWPELDAVYSGVAVSEANELKSRRVRVVRDGSVKDVLVENVPEPAAFTAVREALETFSRNELGIWAIQYSREKLVELSLASEETGDMKWDERDVEYGNLGAAIQAYRESLFYLETVDPKPPHFAGVKVKLESAEAELDGRYREQRFLANKAINLGDWAEARAQLRVLCDLIPDKGDPRHKEANAKLIEIDSRLRAAKKGGAK
ncbi:MAG TPA: hypothetical protein DER26_02270 [Verrucomicrobia bacterium]|nr:hypothetical protein [Verrucomicrobiota bacterium]